VKSSKIGNTFHGKLGGIKMINQTASKPFPLLATPSVQIINTKVPVMGITELSLIRESYCKKYTSLVLDQAF
jgi:hypothetical protein